MTNILTTIFWFAIIVIAIMIGLWVLQIFTSILLFCIPTIFWVILAIYVGYHIVKRISKK